jgi:tetratricopeptide (TPR) repeat protein
MDRLATFRAFIEKSPGDPFPRYGLAMELKSQGRLAEASEAFAELIAAFPSYVATYLMAGKVEETLGHPDRAADLYRRGADQAGAKGDLHAKKELEAALDDLGLP